MLFLVLHVILISGFGLFLKHAKNQGHRMNPIGVVNYVTALLISVASVFASGSFDFTPLSMTFGLANGITYSIGFVLVTIGLRLSGVVVTFAVVRLSLVVPVVFAILFWNEIPNAWQAIGILLACGALPLLGARSNGAAEPKASQTPARKKEEGAGQGLGVLVVTALFINSGASRLATKAFNEMCPIDQKPAFLVFLFAVTTVVYTTVCLRQKTRPTLAEAVYGVVIGICNVAASWTFLAALDHVDALIAFPVSGSGGVIFTAVVGVLALGERLDRKSTVGVIITILALILVNL